MAVLLQNLQSSPAQDLLHNPKEKGDDFAEIT